MWSILFWKPEIPGYHHQWGSWVHSSTIGLRKALSGVDWGPVAVANSEESWGRERVLTKFSTLNILSDLDEIIGTCNVRIFLSYIHGKQFWFCFSVFLGQSICPFVEMWDENLAAFIICNIIPQFYVYFLCLIQAIFLPVFPNIGQVILFGLIFYFLKIFYSLNVEENQKV